LVKGFIKQKLEIN